MKQTSFSTDRAKIVLICDDAAARAELTKTFATCQFSVSSLDHVNQAELAIVDTRGRRLAGKQINSITGALRRSSPEASTLYLIDRDLPPEYRAALRRSGEILPTEDDYRPALIRSQQILRLRVAGEETGERLKTLAEMNRLGEYPSLATDAPEPKILIAGPPGAHALNASTAIKKITQNWRATISPGQTLRALDAERFDCAIFLPNEQNTLLQSLARSLHRSRKHTDLPIIHVASDCDHIADLAEAGARDFILADFIAQDLAPRVMTASRRSRLAISMRNFLSAAVGEGVVDPTSAAFSSAFLSKHGARICSRADRSENPIAVSTYKLNVIGYDNDALRLDRRSLRQAAALMKRISRATDIIARISADSFAILTPSTTEADAAHLSNRIQGVLNNSLFKNNQNKLFSVETYYDVRAKEPGQCVEEVVAASIAGLARIDGAQTTDVARH